jgi:uncharacterized membrane protein
MMKTNRVEPGGVRDLPFFFRLSVCFQLRAFPAGRQSLNYNNKKDEKNIYLKKDGSSNVIDIAATHFSQEADLGSSATYPLSLERFSTSDDIYRLVVINLPRQITYDFTDGGSKVSQIYRSVFMFRRAIIRSA